MQRLTFKKDEIITPQDASMTSLMIVRTGVAISERANDGSPIELARLAPGDLFGERGVLMGTSETARIRALTSVVVYEISKDHLANVMRERPTLAEELGLLLAKRIEVERHLFRGNDQPEDARPTSIAARIRHLFEVPRATRH